MTAAVGPRGELVRIGEPATFLAWKARRDLACMLCGYPVVPYTHYRSGNRFIRHGRGISTRANGSTGRGSQNFEHALLEHWICNELRAHGIGDAQVRPRMDQHHPDVSGSRDGYRYAIEVPWSPISLDAARIRTKYLHGAGYDQVLWVTRHAGWADQLPAVDLRTSVPTVDDDYGIRTGFLSHDLNGSEPVAQPTSLRKFLRQWAEPDSLAWAYLTTTTSGWATVTEWKQYTEQQARTVERLQSELEDALQCRDNFREIIVDQRQVLEETECTLEAARRRVERAAQVVDEKCSQLRAAAVEHGETLAAIREQMSHAEQRHDREQQALRRAADEELAAEREGRRAVEQRAELLDEEVSAVSAAVATRDVVIRVLFGACFVLLLLIWLL
ncbi:hypothetical protein ACWDT6_28350 [Nocardia grenadensis]